MEAETSLYQVRKSVRIKIYFKKFGYKEKGELLKKQKQNTFLKVPEAFVCFGADGDKPEQRLKAQGEREEVILRFL